MHDFEEERLPRMEEVYQDWWKENEAAGTATAGAVTKKREYKELDYEAQVWGAVSLKNYKMLDEEYNKCKSLLAHWRCESAHDDSLYKHQNQPDEDEHASILCRCEIEALKREKRKRKFHPSKGYHID